MDFQRRKFFLFMIILAPIFACALPNFAALVPTPVASPSLSARQSDLQFDSEEGVLNLDVSVPAPSKPESLNQLPDLPNLENLVDIASSPSDVFEIVSGLRYSIEKSTILSHQLTAGQSMLYSLSAEGSITLLDRDGVELSNVIAGQTEDSAYVLIAQTSQDSVQIKVELTEPSAILSVENLSQVDDVALSLAGFADIGDVVRAELESTAGNAIVAILRPAPGFDGILELYGPDGIIQSLDKYEAGGAEILVYVPRESEKVTFVIYGYQQSFGEFELTVIELGR
ncbi:MAG: hypothetical protein ACI9EW_003234 [Cellvibrionaceae bacterium]|jgi:hypothetical protein